MKDEAAVQGLSCPVYKKCGGCQLDVTYPQQLGYKMRIVREILGKFGKVEPVVGMDDPMHYRCKVSSAFGYARGRIITGVWQSGAGKLVQVENCALEDERAKKIIDAIRILLPVHKLRTYDEVSGQGFLRFVTVRIGKQTGEILVALGTGQGKFPQLPAFADALLQRCPEITTLTRNVSAGRLNLLLGENETVLHGAGYITDILCGKRFRISARSFFQVNPLQTERLYSLAVEAAGLTGRETVIDAYCGVGTIGIIAADQAKEVLSVEVNADAVKNARTNAELNGLGNVRVFEGDAGEFMTAMAEDGRKADVVFTDPPRAGCSREFLSSLLSLSPEKIVYISCNPETQERDLKFLTKNGYKVKKIRPVDMFPYTRHIETVVLLSREKADDYVHISVHTKDLKTSMN